ncbi:Scr1 family TA system antitoxin-like transcriptional regulator [Kitasatospora phosalacinea]|uniref:Scr1 family TA system antitoxin-like transcriptional regulator n=1 Tax=Kitasatospora phosalacinea TaxID=2065 RepID=UPI00068D26DA|nr:Scr1 family TA system antitoxin-like transcriptional regulator [Kitasatospora phosalacinea]
MRINKLDPSSSPLAALGWQLRERRRHQGLTQGELGKLVNYTGAYVSIIENGGRRPPLEFIRGADRVLGAAGALEGMWWMIDHTSFRGGFPEYVGLEATARRIRAWDIGLPPGIAQTEEYARALQSGYVERGAVTPEQAEEQIGVLLGRHAVLRSPNPPELHLVLDESCIRTVVGSPEVTARQLSWLAELAARPNVALQVMPFDRGAKRPLSHPIKFLTMVDGSVVGYTETHERGYVEYESETVEGWLDDYHRLQVEALPPADSLALLSKARKDLCNMLPVDKQAKSSWYKSSYSDGAGECVEISTSYAESHDVVLVRDSKDPEGSYLTLPASSWRAFADAAGSGLFPGA